MDENSNIICLVDDEPEDLQALADTFSGADYLPRTYLYGKPFLEDLDEINAVCVILDARMPDIHGLEIVEEIVKRRPDLPFVMVSGSSDIPIAVRAMKMGASDFIEKPFDPQHLIEVTQQAIEAHNKWRTGEHSYIERQKSLVERLTPRETQVLKLLLEGCQNKIIAYRLGISERTVEVHRSRIMRRLEVRTFAELVRVAVEAGMSPEH